MAILFYYTREKYGAFGGWSPHGFELDGHHWQTLEHYYQAQKYAGTPYADQVRLAPTPRVAKEMGRRPDWPLRADWDEVKDAIMWRAVLAKIEAHPEVRTLLLSTGDEELVENSRTDYYWGRGADGTGQNKLGKTLMSVRAHVRARLLEGSMTAQVDHIPVIWVMPEPCPQPARLVLWLPPFTCTKEEMLPYLHQLAAAGFVALSLDLWQHGARGVEPRPRLIERVFGNFRRHMWPLLGQTTLDVVRVRAWAVANLPVAPDAFAGGISMGGDIAVAAAGLDARIVRVAAIVATPDWLRPGMHDLFNPGVLLAPGEADAYAQFFYDHLNPITHLANYTHCPAITFECGADDTHVPPDGALRFQAALQETYAAQADRLRVNLLPGVGHDNNVALWQSSLAWFVSAVDRVE